MDSQSKMIRTHHNNWKNYRPFSNYFCLRLLYLAVRLFYFLFPKNEIRSHMTSTWLRTNQQMCQISPGLILELDITRSKNLKSAHFLYVNYVSPRRVGRHIVFPRASVRPSVRLSVTNRVRSVT